MGRGKIQLIFKSGAFNSLQEYKPNNLLQRLFPAIHSPL